MNKKYKDTLEGEPVVRKTTPVLTSDIGGKTVLVLVHSVMLP